MKNVIVRLHNLLARRQIHSQRDFPVSAGMSDISDVFNRIEAEVAVAVADLDEGYVTYKQEISSGGSAASLRLSALLLAICRLAKPRRVIDFGSGFTSYVLRRYQSERASSVVAYSVDDSSEWLARTRQYLIANGLMAENLFDWPSFEDRRDFSYDLSVLDIRPIQRRLELLPKLMSNLPDGGMVLVDDLHKPHLKQPLLEMVERQGWKCIGLRDLTLDEYGRYACILSRPTSND